MRYFGGGIGHLNNTLPHQPHRSDPLDPNSNEMAVEEDEEDDTGSDARDGPQDVIMNNGELEVGENDEEDGSGDDNDEGGDSDNYDYDESDVGGDEDRDDYDEDEEGDKDKESTYSSDGYAYASP